MDMLEVHAEALQTSSGPYHEFLLMYRTSKPIVYGFVEGREDPSFYRGFIENALPDGWTVRLIRSGNRQAVLGVLSAMPWDRFPRQRICFFVDRDLSDYLNEEVNAFGNLYITDSYSIENDIVNSHVFERVIGEIFGVSDLNEDEREAISNQFQANLKFFCEAMAPIMAQILIWKREGARVSLANIKLQKLFLFNNGRLVASGEYPSWTSRVAYAADCVGLSPSDEELLCAAELEFRDKSGLLRVVRGKYLIWLFVESAITMHAAVAHYCSRYPRPPRVRVSLGAGNAITIRGPRAKIPNSLKQFINNNYLTYIRNTEAIA